jgi:hypothetical protein
MTDDNRISIEDFFAALKDFDSNMMVIEEFRNEVKKRQLNFDDE